MFISKKKLAEKVGVSTTWIGYIETGFRRPSLKMIYKIARAIGVNVKDIFPF
mgnify:CR=1 FL=1